MFMMVRSSGRDQFNLVKPNENKKKQTTQEEDEKLRNIIREGKKTERETQQSEQETVKEQ
jgi:hypothetical protein